MMNFYESLAGGANHPINIRQPHPTELKHVAALQHTELPSHRSLDEILAQVHHKDAIQVAAFSGTKMVATVSLSPVPGQHYVYEVDRLVTLPQFRGQGIATKVLLAAEKLAQEKGAKTLVLDARPDKHGFFSSVGYDRTDGHASGAHINMTKPTEPHGD